MKFGNISFEKSIGGVVFRKDQGDIKYLLLKYRSGQWDFPKGHIAQGESEMETLAREIREETGLTEMGVIEGFRVSSRYFYVAKGNEKKERIKKGVGINIFKKVIHYLVQTTEEKVILDFENKGYAWVDFEKAMKMLGNKDSKKTLEKAQSFLKKN